MVINKEKFKFCVYDYLSKKTFDVKQIDFYQETIMFLDPDEQHKGETEKVFSLRSLDDVYLCICKKNNSICEKNLKKEAICERKL